jgi:hypothetical protein
MTYCDFDQHGFHATADRISSDLKRGRLEDASDLLRRELHENPSEISELISQVKNIQERQHANGDRAVALDQVIVRPDAATDGESSEVLIRDNRTGYIERIGGITFGEDAAAGSAYDQNIGQQNFGQQGYSYPPPMNYECAPPVNYGWTPPLYSNGYCNSQMYSGYEQCAVPYSGYARPWHHRYGAPEPYLNAGIYQPSAYGCYPESGNYIGTGSYPGFGLSLNLGSLLVGRGGRRW